MGDQIIFLYPGQGAQEVGMGFDLYQTYPIARELFERADHFLGFSLSRICFQGPIEELNKDLNAQLAVYTTSCIITEILRTYRVVPNATSGYSSGFYAAGYSAACYDFSTGLDIVRLAGGILLEEGLQIEGRMAVIFGLSKEKVAKICRRTGDVDVAIVNTLRQTIISGRLPSVQQAITASLNEGALDAYLLPAQTAYHSRFMKNGGITLLNQLKNRQINDPQIPIMSYWNLAWINDKSDLVSAMAAQVSNPVRWVDLIKKIGGHQRSMLFEVGPGTIIFRTLKWIDRRIEILNTSSNDRLTEAIEKYAIFKKSAAHDVQA